MNGIKNILCYGDSNTYGFSPEWVHNGPRRHDESIRWPLRMEKLLGDGYRVTEAGLAGRTTVFDDPMMPDRNGLTHLRACVESHLPLDLAIIALGTNDTKDVFHAAPEDITAGLVKLLEAMDSPDWYFLFPKPKILILCPAPIREPALHLPDGLTTPLMLEKSRKLAPLYAAAAAEHGCDFFDIASVVQTSDEDGIHMNETAHCILAEALAKKVKEILA